METAAFWNRDGSPLLALEKGADKRKRLWRKPQPFGLFYAISGAGPSVPEGLPLLGGRLLFPSYECS